MGSGFNFICQRKKNKLSNRIVEMKKARDRKGSAGEEREGGPR